MKTGGPSGGGHVAGPGAGGLPGEHMGSSGLGTPDPSGPCMGGPIQGESGQSIGNGNYRFACVDGGSTVVHLGN